TPSRESSFVSKAIALWGSYGFGASFRTTTMIFPGTTVRDPRPHDESPRTERCHSDSGRWNCTPSVPRIGIRIRPVSRSSQYDWFSAFNMSRRRNGVEDRFPFHIRRRWAFRTDKATSKAEGMYCLYTA